MSINLDDIELSITAAGRKLFTPRECQVLLGDADGKEDKTMARSLGISPSAVSIYNHRIYEKLQVRGDSINLRSAALIKAIAYGYMTIMLKDVVNDAH